MPYLPHPPAIVITFCLVCNSLPSTSKPPRPSISRIACHVYTRYLRRQVVSVAPFGKCCSVSHLGAVELIAWESGVFLCFDVGWQRQGIDVESTRLTETGGLLSLSASSIAWVLDGPAGCGLVSLVLGGWSWLGEEHDLALLCHSRRLGRGVVLRRHGDNAWMKDFVWIREGKMVFRS
jgi:hypothetical protein